MENQKVPVVFEYDNYRTYLRDTYTSLKHKRSTFSYRNFSRLAGFSSPNFLKLVMDGKRNLSRESIARFSKALKHSKEESFFFRHLVLLNQASSSEEKMAHTEALLKSKSYRKHHPLREAEFNYYSQWYYVPIREMTCLNSFRFDKNQVASNLYPPIKPEQVQEAVRELEKLGLIARDATVGWRATHRSVTTPDEVHSHWVAEFQKSMIRKGVEAIESFPREMREISSVTISLDSSGIGRVKEMIQEFRKELIDISERNSQADQVYQINFQMFPLTKKLTGGET